MERHRREEDGHATWARHQAEADESAGNLQEKIERCAIAGSFDDDDAAKQTRDPRDDGKICWRLWEQLGEK